MPTVVRPLDQDHFVAGAGMSGKYIVGSCWIGIVLGLLVVCGGCGGESKSTTDKSLPAHAPGVEGMKWLKKNGYLDENGRPVPRSQK